MGSPAGSGYEVTDSFSVSARATDTDADIWIQSFPGYPIGSVERLITTVPFGGTTFAPARQACRLSLQGEP